MDKTISLLPPNATRTERALAQVGARLENIPTPVRDLWNPDQCPAALLPWLAWSFGVEQWDSQWSEEQKRSTIKNALFVQRHKGTIGAVRSALAAISYAVRVQEWFNQVPQGDPFTYRLLLDVSQEGISQAALKQILEVAEETKNLRSHMSIVQPQVTSRSVITLAVVASVGNEIAVGVSGRRRMDGSWTLSGQKRLNAID